ncbi:hypothetical protein CLOSTHATH_07327 [Hungatella hathewayi DSM 13479]|uniref:Uncharacterized protein n=1 Tax=Hungatella hathewayi DSM 13479 TaxID=566550 RepID=D3AUL1_9FIRM|nr:hypothetical protein CLOSTHATH_07327 [Hungatella hathewayi DSM 13479]
MNCNICSFSSFQPLLLCCFCLTYLVYGLILFLLLLEFNSYLLEFYNYILKSCF